MRDNWICIEGRHINLDNLVDIEVFYNDIHDNYMIRYSCNPYGREMESDYIKIPFETEEEAQDYLEQIMMGED